MGKKNKSDKAKNNLVDIGEDIKRNKKKYDDAPDISENLDDETVKDANQSDNAKILSDMVKQYEKIGNALKNDAKVVEEDAVKKNPPKYDYINGGILDLDAELTVGETVLGVVALGVFIAGAVALARVGWLGFNKVRKLL